MYKAIAVIEVLVLAATAGAQGKGKGKGKHGAEPGAPATITISFSDSDRREIHQWVQAQPPQGLPPGLAKRGELPPGLQKQLQKNGTLPPGLQKKVSPFPATLSQRLAPLPTDCGCQRVFLEGKAMIVARATGAILDLISLF